METLLITLFALTAIVLCIGLGVMAAIKLGRWIVNKMAPRRWLFTALCALIYAAGTAILVSTSSSVLALSGLFVWSFSVVLIFQYPVDRQAGKRVA